MSEILQCSVVQVEAEEQLVLLKSVNGVEELKLVDGTIAGKLQNLPLGLARPSCVVCD